MRARIVLLPALMMVILIESGLVDPVQAQESCAGPFISISEPLNDLGSNEYVRLEGGPTGFSGGLYPGGSNVRPAAHEAAGIAAATQIMPLDANGNPDPAGKIVMISVGMSNTSSEFNGFISRAHQDPEVNPRLLLVNGAQGGRTAERWVDAGAETWQEVNNQLARVGATGQQVQVAWIKQTLVQGGDFPAKTLELQADLEAIARNLLLNFPHIKIAYFSSRTRSYTYWRGLSPEPLAFEGGFAVKWMIEKQINGDPALNFDPTKGEVVAPYLSWGPYLWIDGLNPRSDGRVWAAEDMAADCTHPSESGNEKVGDMLMAFFKTDTTTMGWFLNGTAAPVLPTATRQPTTTETAGPAAASTQAASVTVPPTPSPELLPVTPAGNVTETPLVAETAVTTPAAGTPENLPTSFPAGLVVIIVAIAGMGIGLGWFLLRKR